ncbi:uncharacterized protein PHACADRAFT_153708 [Phanerochaete carnosa HHB-10118-sp]|uniref:Uncharacterized protein n=1 Tax=Phanerochaete carnosa (strain HHB-10118-sp) TaxID=650164 RepID=K5UKQ7_PHACS|nr:uncharacterized protein PHACADRAFT_153708 [Phanerochaete carnosa HHB-10118-sp]EKM50231.1 hypothetical protein PHACADRAFT_153708 [Phanerochaete carnosa HHB-10118-sp]
MHSEVYASELKKTVQEGEALWFPEPSQDGEVQIGDVGYIHEGAFMRLFNAIDPEKYPVLTALEDYRLPAAFEPLRDRRAQRIDQRLRALAPGPYKSKSVVTRKVEASASACVVHIYVGAGMEYECTKEKGALLILRSDAKKVQASSEKTFGDYVAKFHDSWCKFALDLGIASAEAMARKIVLVCGWVKTYPDWSVTAFTSSGSKFRASLDVKTIGVGGITGSYSGTEHVEGPVMNRWGVYARARAPEEERIQNQCIFVKCIYAKRRHWPYFFRAGAGPHQLPDQRDANSGQDGPAIEVSNEQYQSDTEAGDDMVHYSPMDAVLDYILEVRLFSAADYAGVDDVYSELECCNCGLQRSRSRGHTFCQSLLKLYLLLR